MLYKDGLRYLKDSISVQRWICRSCGYRFTETKPLQKNLNCHISRRSTSTTNRQVCELLTEDSKNLAAIENPPKNGLAGATEQAADAKGKIIEHAFWMKKEGYAENTITRRIRLLTTLMKRGANLLDPESVKTVIAKQQGWNLKTKENLDIAFGVYFYVLESPVGTKTGKIAIIK